MCVSTSVDETPKVKLLSKRIYAFVIWKCPHKGNEHTHIHSCHMLWEKVRFTGKTEMVGLAVYISVAQ